MRVNFSSGAWVELHDHKTLTAKQVRPIVALVIADQGTDTSFQAVDMFVSALLADSSAGPNLDPGDLTWSDYVELVNQVKPLMREALGADNPTPDDAGNPESPTGA